MKEAKKYDSIGAIHLNFGVYCQPLHTCLLFVYQLTKEISEEVVE